MEKEMSLDREVGEIKITVQNIEKLLLKQNGRVGKLEDRTDKLEKWRTYLTGAWVVISTAAAAIWSKS